MSRRDGKSADRTLALRCLLPAPLRKLNAGKCAHSKRRADPCCASVLAQGTVFPSTRRTLGTLPVMAVVAALAPAMAA